MNLDQRRHPQLFRLQSQLSQRTVFQDPDYEDHGIGSGSPSLQDLDIGEEEVLSEHRDRHRGARS